MQIPILRQGNQRYIVEFSPQPTPTPAPAHPLGDTSVSQCSVVSMCPKTNYIEFFGDTRILQIIQAEISNPFQKYSFIDDSEDDDYRKILKV